jgi:hypothetical protein
MKAWSRTAINGVSVEWHHQWNVSNLMPRTLSLLARPPSTPAAAALLPTAIITGVVIFIPLKFRHGLSYEGASRPNMRFVVFPV